MYQAHHLAVGAEGRFRTVPRKAGVPTPALLIFEMCQTTPLDSHFLDHYPLHQPNTTSGRTTTIMKTKIQQTPGGQPTNLSIIPKIFV